MKKIRIYLVALTMIFLVSCKQKVEKTEAIRPVFYKPVAEMSVSGKRTFAGVSQAEHEAKLSFKVGGTLEKILYKLGETVRKGKTIAYLNSEDYRINYQKAEVAKKNAEIQLSSARSAFNRIEKLYANNNVSLSDFEKAKAQYESAKAMLKTAESQLRAARNQLEYTKLKAPFTGTISKILAKENEMIGAGRPVLIFSSNGKTELRTQVPENVIKKIKLGQQVKVKFTVIPDKVFNGVISEIARSTGGASTYPVIIDLTDKYVDILPGMACTIEMDLGQNNGSEIVIPPDAVAHDEDGDFVYVVKHSNTKGIYLAKRRNVTLGKLTSMGYEIKKGLNTNDTIITAGLNFMYDGRKVKLLKNQ
ncbi:efflux RND transporter periplasmic adaptor subunit [Candidatus Sulfidibacterium hydrothermale]|uniref:efflux RND transporter periplasmic adaptor subunit n=1 Tax=Candidatus Sulfidibacterium hydrothermale TaxID=2875962 RepID=UPI001F0B6F6C|nr:efflux RND transporter periplasmic adaptor subunit [Candidatus Sulfidibacterium hydrothermale]UBM62708.1 efflux RND transporter periplasmic adaptor subunit [Candidatus Sulfidibacterium hydrothermale]